MKWLRAAETSRPFRGNGVEKQRGLGVNALRQGRPHLRSPDPVAFHRRKAGGDADRPAFRAEKVLREGRRGGMGAHMARNANPYDFANDAGHVMDVATADKLARHPELLCVPLDNITRWIASGKHTAASVQRLKQWRTWILEAQQDEAGFRRLLDLLRDDSEEARHWKSWSPFAGVLEAGERREILNQCMPVS